MVPAFEQAAWTLNPGQSTQTPVKTQFGYHIILRGKTLPAKITPFTEVKKDIQSRLISEKKKQKYEVWIKKHKQEAKIEIKEEATALPPELPESVASAAPSP